MTALDRAPAEAKAGSPIAAALACYTLWGLLPILFLLSGRLGAGAFEIVAWRTICALPCAALLVALAGDLGALRRLPSRTWGALAASALLIAINWTTYVWAVGSGRTISASLGYYILPLLNVAAGAWLFGERIGRGARIALALAAVGVVLQGIATGELPWISLVLAISFCGYGIVRKTAAVEARVGLLVECLLLAAPACLYAVLLARAGQASFGAAPGVTAALLAGGPATVIPLALFAFAARRLPLSTMGFAQFITPTLQFIVGVEAGEALTPLRACSFLFIWAGVILFAVEAWRQRAAGRA